jgi:hypothetical protein
MVTTGEYVVEAMCDAKWTLLFYYDYLLNLVSMSECN